MGEVRTPVRDRGHIDLVSDPGSKDLVRDGAHRDLVQGKGLQDLVRDLGVQESVKLGALLGGKLREVPWRRPMTALPSGLLFERLPKRSAAEQVPLRPAYLPMIGPACDRGGDDLLRDPGHLDLARDGTLRDLRAGPGVQDRVRDRGARESFVLGAIRLGDLPGELTLQPQTARSGAVARGSKPIPPARRRTEPSKASSAAALPRRESRIAPTRKPRRSGRR